MATAALIMAAVLRQEPMSLPQLITAKSGLQALNAEWQQLLWVYLSQVCRQGACPLVAADMLLRFLIQGSKMRWDATRAPSIHPLCAWCSLQHLLSRCHTMTAHPPARCQCMSHCQCDIHVRIANKLGYVIIRTLEFALQAGRCLHIRRRLQLV